MIGDFQDTGALPVILSQTELLESTRPPYYTGGDAWHRKPPSDEKIWIASVAVVFTSLLIIGIMLGVSQTSTAASGWVAVAGASIVFGSTGVPMKISSLSNEETKLDTVLFACYSNTGIFLISLPLLIYLLATGQFIFYPWAIVGAADIMIISFFAFNAVRDLGYATAPAIWAGIGMISAFLWGVVVFNEPVDNIIGASLAIACLVIGVALISTSQFQIKLSDTTYMDPGAEAEYVNPVINITSFYGYIFCLLTGIFDGSLMVPFKLSGATTVPEVLSYIAYFGIGTLIATPVIFSLYTLVILQGKLPTLYLQTAPKPGIVMGILWACGNFLSVNATYCLGMKTGFPLTQTCILITAVWGIYYFKEIRTDSFAFRCKFTLGVFAVCAGSILLGTFG